MAVSIAVAVGLAVMGYGVAMPERAGAQVPEPPFAAIQVGTNGCIEVGVRPDPPFNQPKPFVTPASAETCSVLTPSGQTPPAT